MKEEDEEEAKLAFACARKAVRRLDGTSGTAGAMGGPGNMERTTHGGGLETKKSARQGAGSVAERGGGKRKPKRALGFLGLIKKPQKKADGCAGIKRKRDHALPESNSSNSRVHSNVTRGKTKIAKVATGSTPNDSTNQGGGEGAPGVNPFGAYADSSSSEEDSD